jgi:hypothetical protein
MMEGFEDTPGAGASFPDPADTRSNWRVRDEVQCLPWILQDPPKPDNKVVLRFRTAAQFRAGRRVARTFIDARQNRRLVTAESSPDVSVADLGINRGTSVATNFDEPNAARLGFYDLRSGGHHATWPACPATRTSSSISSPTPRCAPPPIATPPSRSPSTSTTSSW